MIQKAVIVTLVIIIASTSLAGCTSLGIGAKDYSEYYNKQQGDWAIEKPFYKTTTANGFDLYVGVVRDPSHYNFPHTVSYEHFTDPHNMENNARTTFDNSVKQAQADGYQTTDHPQGSNAIGSWEGKSTTGYIYFEYYYSSDISAWVVSKEVWGL